MDLTSQDRRHRLDRLAAEYALGTLSPRARRRLASLARASPVVAQAVRDWELRLAMLAIAVPEVNPPPRVWDRIAGRLGIGAGAGEREGWWSRVRLWRPLAIASMVATFGVGVLHFTAHLDPSRTAIVVVLAAPDSRPAWIATGPVGGGVLNVKAVRTAGRPRRPRARARRRRPRAVAPCSLGLLPTSGSVRLMIPLTAIQTIPALAVSLEPAGGSPTGAPSGPVLYSGKVERI